MSGYRPRNRKRVWAIVAATSASLFGIIIAVIELPAKLNSFFEEVPTAGQHVADRLLLDRRFTGVWTSDLEGVIDATTQEHEASIIAGGPATFSIRVYAGRVEGEMTSVGLMRNYVYSVAAVEGRKRGNSINVVAFDYIGGEKTVLATFRLTLDDRGGGLPLRLTAIRGGGFFLPQEARLYRASTDPSEPLEGSLNMELLSRAVRRGGQTDLSPPHVQ